MNVLLSVRVTRADRLWTTPPTFIFVMKLVLMKSVSNLLMFSCKATQSMDILDVFKDIRK